jgi:riboflavin kinase/FMN adenylyltransferase
MAVVSTGFFDGVHSGHRLVIGTLVEEASRRSEESVVVTFWPHPRNVLQDEARNLRLLSSLDEKKLMLKALGVDRIEVLPFTKEFASMTGEQYLKEVLVGRFGATAAIFGYDNRIGSDHKTFSDLQPLSSSLGLDIIPCKELGSISSTVIRKALAEGRVRDASDMLGYRYGLHGVVVSGNRLGRTIGFPTANMQLYEPLKLIPAVGVYAVEVETLGGKYLGMSNIGVRPTVGTGNALTVETNIFDFDEDIYGLDITIRFIRRIREEKRFPSLTELKAQLLEDKRLILEGASSEELAK